MRLQRCPVLLGRQSNASRTNCTALDNVKADHTLLVIVIPTEEGRLADEGHHTLAETDLLDWYEDAIRRMQRSPTTMSRGYADLLVVCSAPPAPVPRYCCRTESSISK